MNTQQMTGVTQSMTAGTQSFTSHAHAGPSHRALAARSLRDAYDQPTPEGQRGAIKDHFDHFPISSQGTCALRG